AASNAEAEFVKHLACTSYDADRGSLVGRVAIARTTIHIPDVLDDPEYARGELQKLGKYRSVLGGPLIRDGQPLGVLTLSINVVQPFTERQIEVIATFADQAVIAIENTRLFEAEQASKRELTDALEQQTATSNILRTISSSPGELAPVFEAILENATRICGTKLANLFLRDGDIFRTVAMTATSSYPDWWRREPIDVRGNPHVPFGRLAATKDVVHIADLRLERAYIEGIRHFPRPGRFCRRAYSP